MQNIVAVVSTAAIMTVIISYFIVHIAVNKEKFSFKNVVVAVLILTMMASMLNSLTFLIDTPPGFVNTIIAVNFSMVAMTVAIISIFWNVVFGKYSGVTFKISILFSLLLVWNEVSMGVFLYSLGYPGFLNKLDGNFLQNMVSLFGLSLNYYLFIIPMLLEMISVALLVRHSRFVNSILLAIFAMSLFSPTMLGNSIFISIGSILSVGVMIFFMTLFYELLAKRRTSIKSAEMKALSWLFLVFLLMMAGEFLGSMGFTPFGLGWVVYGIAMVAAMLLYFNITFNYNDAGEKRVGWIKYPGRMFWILASSFISEILAAGAIIALFFVTHTVNTPPLVVFSNYLGGVNTFTPLSEFVDGIYLIGAIADNPIFLIIMGVEMGTLVVIRIRKISWKEKRVNLSLALAAFALYTIIGPNFVNSGFYDHLPLWANVGALSPLYPYFVIPLVASYALYAILALLFGRRSYCSTLCPSAVMYGGTLGQEMINYNYEAKISRNNLGSRFKKALFPLISSSWVLLIIVSVVSFYYTRGSSFLSIYGIDASVFFATFTWNFLWYLFFISIPFVGMSPCRRYGWCTTGTFVGFFGKIGLFKLKVNDPQTCITCKTKDCVKACEVGLADLPGQFISKGFFKSSKCVGSGSCIQACPYNNIFFYDIRNYLKEKIK
ncbi:MAG: hypothetical protein B2I17_07010 [Thermoplasmatales archaeon B_DKE]|nr:MAG: hypothetical protein B2I17_07010 [Thermoplasmatales archaeon B_DKE]